MAAASTPGLSVNLALTGQWSGAFEGTVTVTNSSGANLNDWSLSFNSRYQLRNVSNFTVSQQQLSDGSWQVTLSPPSWGGTLAAGGSASSYLQGVLPAGTQLSSLDPTLVLTGAPLSNDVLPAPVPEPTPAPAPAPIPSIPTTEAIATAPAGSDLWGNSFFAPYVDMGLYPVPDLDGLARQ